MKENNNHFIGPLKEHCENFISWKRSGGLKYNTERAMLIRFDRFTCNYSFAPDTLPKEVVEKWCQKREHEHPRTHCSRIRTAKLFAQYMVRCGFDAYVTNLPSEIKSKRKFVAHIYSDSELQKIFSVIDNLESEKYPHGYYQYPVLFRLFYSAGLRLSEAFNIKNKDIDLATETITIRNTKFGKTRIVPLHHDMFTILQNLISHNDSNDPESYVFFRKSNAHKPEKSIGGFFIKVIRRAGLYHGGKSKGMRIHDFRHTFAVRSLRNAYLSGVDVTNFMPYLSAYLGHADLRGTELYLQLTADIYPEITDRFSHSFSTIIPQGDNHEENA